jgi:hypothetical protein
MTKPLNPEELWWTEACEIMVRDNLTLRKAAEFLGKNLLPAECQQIERRKGFQRVLWTVRYKYFQELADNPNRTKQVLLGQIVYAIDQLFKQGSWRDVIDGGLKLAKIEYNVEDTSVNIFQGLTQKDFDEIKNRVKKLASPNEPPKPEGILPSKPN